MDVLFCIKKTTSPAYAQSRRSGKPHLCKGRCHGVKPSRRGCPVGCYAFAENQWEFVTFCRTIPPPFGHLPLHKGGGFGPCVYPTAKSNRQRDKFHVYRTDSNYRLHLLYTFPRGEGAPKGRMRNAGSNVANHYSVSDLLPCRKCIGGLYVFQICQVTARIPHQSKIGFEEPIFASFSPGEAIGAVRLTNSPINRNLSSCLSKHKI